jgi:hypothetical protein
MQPAHLVDQMLKKSEARRKEQAAARRKILEETVSVPCLMCGTAVQQMNYPDPVGITGACIHGGVVEAIWGGYGSMYDNRIFLIALCDACLTQAHAAGRAVDLGGYL